jgi:Predicted nucleoside-diphosphate-sugar epimerases
MASTILILGGTGTVGAKVAALLEEKGEAVRVGTRSPKQPGDVRFDFADPSTFAAAFEGVDRVYLLSPAGYPDQIGLLTPVLDFALARKAKIVFQTAMGVDASDEIPFRRLELEIERSGVPYVFLRPNWFSDNVGTYWLSQVRGCVLRLPADEGVTSFVDARDIAAAAVVALTTNGFDGAAYDLTGPAAVSYAEVADALTREIGRPVAYQPVDDATFIAEWAAAGMSEAYATALSKIFGFVRLNYSARTTGHVEALTGRRPRAFDAYIRDNAAHLRG